MRGIDEPEAALRFLTPSLDHLHSPYLLTGMKAALDRLEAALDRKESILIYGDYDVDGTTAICRPKRQQLSFVGEVPTFMCRTAFVRVTTCAVM